MNTDNPTSPNQRRYNWYHLAVWGFVLFLFFGFLWIARIQTTHLFAVMLTARFVAGIISVAFYLEGFRLCEVDPTWNNRKLIVPAILLLAGYYSLAIMTVMIITFAVTEKRREVSMLHIKVFCGKYCSEVGEEANKWLEAKAQRGIEVTQVTPLLTRAEYVITIVYAIPVKT